MSVDTKIKIPLYKGDTTATIELIKQAIREHFKPIGKVKSIVRVKAKPYNRGDDKSRFNMYEIVDICFTLPFYCDAYDSGKEERTLWTYYDYYSGGEMLALSCGCWGHNEEIAKCLVDTFGGYADFSDCDNIIIDYAQPQPKEISLQRLRKETAA